MMDELEREFVAHLKQYGFFLPAPVKATIKKLAEKLGWKTLGGML